MRRILWVIAVLIIALAVGCSRQPQPHVGEWSAELFMGSELLDRGTFYFSDDGTVQMIILKPGPSVSEGRYIFDYSKNPVQLDINWKDNLVMLGIIRFIGERKNQMQINYTFGSPTRPTEFDANMPSWWLTKKVKK